MSRYEAHRVVLDDSILYILAVSKLTLHWCVAAGPFSVPLQGLVVESGQLRPFDPDSGGLNYHNIAWTGARVDLE